MEEEVNDAVHRLFSGLSDILNEVSKQQNEVQKLLKSESLVLIKLLNCHLVLEYMMDKVLTDNINEYNPRKANLSFSQKTNLLPTEGKYYKDLINGILELNRLRNKFVHNIDAKIEEKDLKEISKFRVLIEKIIDRKPIKEDIILIERFTVICCTILIFYSSELKKKYHVVTADFKKIDELLKSFNEKELLFDLDEP